MPFTGPKILIIGSNSFSGASFAAHSLRKGAEVIGVSRSPEANPVFLPYRWQGETGEFSFHQYDLNHHLDEIMTLVDHIQPEFIVNFAAQSMVAQSWNHPEHWMQTNVVSTVKFHQQLRQRDCLQRYVHVSTPEVYGNTSGRVLEDHPYAPSTPYAVSRAACDMSLRTFHEAYGFPVVFTRAANVYGPGQQLYRIIPRTILFILLGRRLSLHGGGISERSFIHIRDVAEATWRIMKDGRNGDSYHISTDESLSIRRLVEKICVKMQVSFEDTVDMVGDRLGKDAAYHLDSSKIRTELSWSDKVSLDQGLDQCIAWVTENLSTLRELSFDYVHRP